MKPFYCSLVGPFPLCRGRSGWGYCGYSTPACPLTLSLSRKGRGDLEPHARQGHTQVRVALNFGRLRRPTGAVTDALLRARRVIAVDDVFPAKDLGRAGVEGQPQPLSGLVRRALHGDARQVRHGVAHAVDVADGGRVRVEGGAERVVSL